jgi:DNA-binding transcriptional regulator LsrR (DeoR family)
MGLRDPTWLAIRRDLEFGPATVADLASEIHMTRATVRRWIRYAKSQGVVRVVGYEKNHQLVKVWGLGSGQDYRRPKINRPAQLAAASARWRLKNPDKVKRARVRQTERRRARRLAAKQQVGRGLGGASDRNQEQSRPAEMGA